MSVGAWTKLSSAVAQRITKSPRRIFAESLGQNCPQMAFVNPMSIRVPAQTETFSSERIFRGAIENTLDRWPDRIGSLAAQPKM